jgi:hypothetical protein
MTSDNTGFGFGHDVAALLRYVIPESGIFTYGIRGKKL